MAKAEEMIDRAESRIYLSLLPATVPDLELALKRAILRGVQVVVHSTEDFDLQGGYVFNSPILEQVHDRVEGLWLVLVIDAEETSIGERLTQNRARASWTGSPLFVSVVERYLRTDLYLPPILALLRDQAQDLVQDKRQKLAACALVHSMERQALGMTVTVMSEPDYALW